MSKYAKEFDGTCPLTVRRNLRICGKSFKPGDKFDWKKMAVSYRRVRQMFDAGKLESEMPRTKEEALDDLADAGQYWDETPQDYNLEEIDDMKKLRRIADEVGAPYKVSKADQRKAIQDHRKEQD